MADIPMPIVVAVLAAVIALLGAWSLRRRRRRRLEQADSPLPDYQHVLAELRRHQPATVAEVPPPRRDELHERRQQRRLKLDLRPLGEEDRQRYISAWQQLQARVINSPNATVRHGFRLVTDVMTARGFPIEDAAQRRTELTIEGAAVIDDYRRLRTIAERNDRGAATGDEQRKAVALLRALFQYLLAAATAPEESRRHAAG